MNPEQSEIKPDNKNEQQQTNNNIPLQSVANQTISKEESPAIKTEENQANWKAFREQRERERKEREEALKRAAEKHEEAEALRAALEAAISKPNRQQQPSYDDVEETEEQRIDKRVEAIIQQREAQAEKKRQLKEQEDLPKKLNTVYSDFNKVCSQENLDYLEYHYPEIARPLQRLQNDFDKWADIYKAVKKFVPNTDTKQDMARAEKNLQKPGSISTSGGTQGQSSMPSAKLDEARKASNWQRMQNRLKGLS